MTAALRSWSVEKSIDFERTLARMRVTFPDLPEKLEKFLATKIDDPVFSKYGKHDRRMVGHLHGLYHCHLRDDAVLIYALSQKVIRLICVTPHAEIEGRRLKLTAQRIAKLVAA
jgi:mRNA-degrading endonuclease YafQ of YafQ-DinJ toxin-antitoxin module